MPTAKERIEALQQEIRDGKNPIRPTAEIVVLRNLVKAERNKKETLDRPIPMNGSLRADVQKLNSDQGFASLAVSPKVKEAAFPRTGSSGQSPKTESRFSEPIQEADA